MSFKMDWLDLLAVQGTLKSLLQHHSSKASIRGSAFFIVQLSHPYMILEKPQPWLDLVLGLYVPSFWGNSFSLLMSCQVVITDTAGPGTTPWEPLGYSMIGSGMPLSPLQSYQFAETFLSRQFPCLGSKLHGRDSYSIRVRHATF